MKAKDIQIETLMQAMAASGEGLAMSRSEGDGSVTWVVRPDGAARGYDYAAPEDVERAVLVDGRYDTDITNISFRDLAAFEPTLDPDLLEMVSHWDETVAEWLAAGSPLFKDDVNEGGGAASPKRKF